MPLNQAQTNTYRQAWFLRLVFSMIDSYSSYKQTQYEWHNYGQLF